MLSGHQYFPLQISRESMVNGQYNIQYLDVYRCVFDNIVNCHRKIVLKNSFFQIKTFLNQMEIHYQIEHQ